MIALFAVASPAAAEVCDKVRPGWSPEDGPASALSEAVNLLLAPWPLLTLAVLAAAFFVRKPILGHIALALAISLVCVLVVIPFVLANEVQTAAIREGCIGPSYLRHALALTILAGAIAVMAREWRKTET